MFNIDDYKVSRTSKYLLRFILGLNLHENKKLINKDIKNALIELIELSFIQQNKCSVKDIEIEDDYVMITFDAPVNLRLSTFISNFKTISSRYIRNNFKKELADLSFQDKFWDSGYYLRTIDPKDKTCKR